MKSSRAHARPGCLFPRALPLSISPRFKYIDGEFTPLSKPLKTRGLSSLGPMVTSCPAAPTIFADQRELAASRLRLFCVVRVAWEACRMWCRSALSRECSCPAMKSGKTARAIRIAPIKTPASARSLGVRTAATRMQMPMQERSSDRKPHIERCVFICERPFGHLLHCVPWS